MKLPFCRIKDITSVNKTFHISAKTKNSNFSRSNSNFSILTLTFFRDVFKILVRTLGVVVMGTTGIKDANTASLYELAFTATHSVSGQSFEVAWLVAGWVTQALEQGQLGSWAHVPTISTTMLFTDRTEDR